MLRAGRRAAASTSATISSTDVTGCTRAPRTRTTHRHAVYVCMHVCTYAVLRWWRWCRWAADDDDAPAPVGQAFRRLVGVDKVSHGGRHLTTNAKSVPPPAFTVCAMAARHRNIIIADAGRGTGCVLAYLPTYKNVIEGKKFKNRCNVI